MDKKHFISFILLFLILISSSNFAFAERNYSIPLMHMDVLVNDDGSIHVTETIHYSFQGTYRGVYRDIPLNEQKIANLQINTSGAYSKYSTSTQNNNEHITIYLYSNPQKTEPITDREVDVTIEYDYLYVVKFYNDVAELHYKLVGRGWDKDIQKLTANIYLKSNSGVKYWLNPPYYLESSQWHNNSLEITSTTIPSGKYFEVRMIIPKTQFMNNPPYGIKINQNGASAIEKVQNDYQNYLNVINLLYSVVAILLVLTCFIPFIIYWKYGREPKIDYKAEYERDLPSQDPPAIVNAICGNGFSKKVGEPDIDGFKATILDLIDRKFILIVNPPSEESENSEKSLFLKLNHSKKRESLKEFELYAYNFLKAYSRNKVISLEEISNSAKTREDARIFTGSYLNWRGAIKTQIFNDEKLKKLFSKKGDLKIKKFGKIGLLSILILIWSVLNLPTAKYITISSLLLIVVSIISLILPQKIGGQWTPHGEEYNARWQNFKKYIHDFSLIKEYPPESVKIWNKYLVYATALGEAKAVRKAMELSLPAEELASSDIFMFHYYGGYHILSESIDAGTNNAFSPNGSFENSDGGEFGGGGGVGGAGGGAGGGGGGAF